MTAKRGGGKGKTLANKIRQAGTKRFVDVP